MEATSKKTDAPTEKEEKKKRSGWEMFVNFMAMGGLIVVVIGALGIAVLISILWK